MSLIDIGKIVEKQINEFKPDTIFTHCNVDVNNDHLIVFQAVLQATRPCSSNFVERVYLFEILSSTEWRYTETFKPNVFISLDESHIEAKINAMNQYDSELKAFPYPRSEEGIRSLARYRGMQAGCNYAEAFCLLRERIK
ncbi:hypothetical protein AGMMS50212_03000 [Spirochaetia bacterium]|nr:hypothetical protein AGMMS50212_03000 [Spirochaetia bacterium]